MLVSMYTLIFYVHVGFEVLTAVVMKSSTFWDITPVDFHRTTRRYIPEDITLLRTF
jgi:hypothetical protein